MTSLGIDTDKKPTFHIHIALLIDHLRIALHQLNSEVFVVQFVHNTLAMHKVVDEQQSFHRCIETPFHRLVARGCRVELVGSAVQCSAEAETIATRLLG